MISQCVYCILYRVHVPRDGKCPVVKYIATCDQCPSCTCCNTYRFADYYIYLLEKTRASGKLGKMMSLIMDLNKKLDESEGMQQPFLSAPVAVIPMFMLN